MNGCGRSVDGHGNSEWEVCMDSYYVCGREGLCPACAARLEQEAHALREELDGLRMLYHSIPNANQLERAKKAEAERDMFMEQATEAHNECVRLRLELDKLQSKQAK